MSSSRRFASHSPTVVAIVTLTQLVTAMTNAVLPTIAPKIAESLGVEPVLIGYQVSLLFGAAMFGTLYGGSFVTRFGPARTAQICTAMCAAGLALFAVPHVGFIVLGSVIAGFGTGLVNPSAAQIMVSYTPAERRNLLFSIKQTGMPLGGVLTSLSAPAIAVAFGWQWALLPVIALAVLSIAANQAARPVWDRERSPGAPMGRQAMDVIPLVWREPAIRWLSLVGLCFSAVQRILMTFVIIYLVSERGYGLIEAGLMLSVMQAAGSVARPVWGWLADRIGSSLAVLALIMAITVAGTMLLIVLEPGWPRPLVYLLFAALGLSALGWNGVLHAEAARLSPPGLASAIAGGTTFFVFAGVLVGPSFFTTAYGWIGSFAATYPLVVVIGVASLAMLGVARRRSRRASRGAGGATRSAR